MLAVLRLIELILKLLSLLLLSVILIGVVFLILPLFDNVLTSKAGLYLVNMNRALASDMGRYVPTTVKGVDLTNWILIFAAFIIKMFIDNQNENVKDKIYYIEAGPVVDNFRKKTNLSEKLFKNVFGKESKLKKLQREFARIKEELDKLGKELTFLSVDVVGSTKMKEGIDPPTVEHAFSEFKNYIEDKLKKNSYIKATWTPDGVMSCFPDFLHAFSAAKDIINSMVAFNNSLNMFKNDFNVRCGINSGFVYFDNISKIEDLNDRNIDIAAHLQETAEPNSICAARESVNPPALITQFVCLDKVVDGRSVCIWKAVRNAAAEREA
ncbi:MAG: hypothetical protein JXJ19_08720 [Elusimicrobia bacterium]|nr:hypothetical protein [Elusimicrobiota bacterium]